MGKMEQIISTPLTSGGIHGENGNEMALQGKGGEDVVSSVRTSGLKSGDGLCLRLAAQKPISLPAGARSDSALLSIRQSCKASSIGCRPGPTCSSRPCR